MSRETHVIVGASLAGASAAAELRKRGFDGRIVLIGDEPHRPYERPELSKKYLRGEPDVDVAVHDSGFYGEQDIDLVLGTPVERVDVGGRAVEAGHRRIGFDRLTWDVASAIEALIRSRAAVDPDDRADTVRPLTELAAA